MYNKSIPSVMKHDFSKVPHADIQRSSFNRTHGFKGTFNAGYLVPFYIDEVMPGDTVNLRATAFARMATPEFPFMDNLFVDTFFFYVPLRLLWDNFQKFMGEQKNPGDSTDYLIPQMTSPAVTGYAVESLSDYFGIPTEVPGLSHSSLWHRAYNFIYNEWFRDQNLQNSVVVDLDDGPDNPADYVLLRRGKRHDYFTSALPWPQKGPSVSIPLAGNAPVLGIGTTLSTFTTTGTDIRLSNGTMGTGSNWTVVNPNFKMQQGSTTGYPGIYADMSTVTASTINQWRQAFQMQKFFERDARGGTRFTEILKAHFGVTAPDFRLQRPEYLGGGSSPINVNPIAQTSSSDETSPQGNLAAMATFSFKGHGFVKSFVEHGVILGLVNVRADINYQQGLNRMFSRRTRYDFYWPTLAHLGEQAILNKEIYAQGTGNPTQDAAVFGYQERWAEYRYKPSLITGKFRSNFAQSLDMWHLAQDFTALPVLNSSFIVDNPPIERVIAVPSESHFLFDSFIHLSMARPMPVYSVPGLIDHF